MHRPHRIRETHEPQAPVHATDRVLALFNLGVNAARLLIDLLHHCRL
jgi:hypothetical protein